MKVVFGIYYGVNSENINVCVCVNWFWLNEKFLEHTFFLQFWVKNGTCVTVERKDEDANFLENTCKMKTENISCFQNINVNFVFYFRTHNF